jgi:hypothetical protein
MAVICAKSAFFEKDAATLGHFIYCHIRLLLFFFFL